ELNLDDRVGPLSVGQMQKLAIILALGHEPDLLVLDEPAASLDPVARRQFLETLLDRVGARTVLFSTHITSDLERVADRVAVLKDGKIVYSGELDALKDGVKRLRIQAAAPLPNGSFRVPGMLHARVTGNEAVVCVQDFTADLPERIAQQWSASVAVQDLNLEDNFPEPHHGGFPSDLKSLPARNDSGRVVFPVPQPPGDFSGWRARAQPGWLPGRRPDEKIIPGNVCVLQCLRTGRPSQRQHRPPVGIPAAALSEETSPDRHA